MHIKPSHILLTLCLLSGWLHAETPSAPPLYQQPQWWWSILGPAKDTPTKQLAYADAQAQKGHTRKAIRHYRRLANFWPEAPQAPTALITIAQNYAQKNKLRLAFNGYQNVINRYAGSFDYLNIVKQQIILASKIENKRVGGLGIFPGFDAPERALPYYAQIITNAPQWEKAAEIHFTIGAIHEETKAYQPAIEAYETALLRFPDSPWAQPASFHKAYCMTLIARERPNDDAAAESAWAMLTQHLNTYPTKKNSAQALQLQQEMRARLAKSLYQQATYYDNIHRPKSALIAYQSFLQQFPNSEWTEHAQSRINALKQTSSQ